MLKLKLKLKSRKSASPEVRLALRVVFVVLGYELRGCPDRPNLESFDPLFIPSAPSHSLVTTTTSSGFFQTYSCYSLAKQPLLLDYLDHQGIEINCSISIPDS